MNRLWLISLAVLLLLTSCGDDGDRAETLSETTTTTEGQAEGADDPAQAIETSDEVPTSADLTGKLLQLADLPEGFTISPPDEDDGSDVTDSCDEASDMDDPVVEVNASYMKDTFGPFVVSNVAWYEDADQLMDDLVTMAEACREWTDTDEDGATTNGSFSALEFPTLGDRTFALTMTADAGGFPFLGQLVFMKVDDHVVTSVFTLGYGGPSGIDLDPLARVAADRA